MPLPGRTLSAQLVWPVVGLVLIAVLANVAFAAWLATRSAVVAARTSRERIVAALDRSRIALVPAVLDANYVRYTLKLAVGDVLTVRSESGGAENAVSLRIAGLLAPSIWQGSAVIAESAFEKLFPGTGGYRFLLVDVPPAAAEKTGQLLSRLLENRGLALTPATDRLNEFNAVQNTYLRIFSALGGLGLMLSTAGLGLLLARTVLERRGEFGLLQAVGFQRGALRRIILGENVFLLLAGMVVGVVAAVLAVWPVSQGASLPLRTLAAILVGGVVFCGLAAHFALRGRLINALRSE
jgi:ABC-type antimicrobial peptide transport system permease subunit